MIDRENHCKLGKKKENAMKRSKAFKRGPFMVPLFMMVLYLLYTAYFLYDYIRFHYAFSVVCIVTGLVIFGIALIDLFEMLSYDSMQLVYGFDYYKELELYKSKPLVKSNKSNKSYMYYSEWKSHIISEYKELIGYEDFYKELNDRARYLRASIEVFKSINIPIICVIIAAFALVSSKFGINVVLVIIEITAFLGLFSSAFSLLNLHIELYYNEDLMEIVFPNNAEK